MKKGNFKLLGMAVLLCIALQACGKAPVATAVAVAPSVPQPTNTVPAPTVEAATATSAPTEPPVPSQTPEPTKIQHLTKPVEPSYIPEQKTADCTLGRTYASTDPVVIQPICDNPAAEFIERPVIANTIEYLPYLDIVSAQFGGSRDWLFARFNLFDTPKATIAGDIYYFLKLDFNLDGRNSNVLVISVKNPPLDSFNWTVNGVQAWTSVDGTLSPLFDQGVGADPDLIWTRRSPKAVELAFKTSMFKDPIRFAWTAWDYQGSLTPTDLALSSSTASAQYQIDKTCAWGFNISADGLIDKCMR